MDVDAGNCWHAVVLNAHEVVVSVVGLSVNTNGADCTWGFLGNSHQNCAIEVSQNIQLNVVSASLFNAEVCTASTFNAHDALAHEVIVEQEVANVVSVFTTVPNNAILVESDNLELSTSLELNTFERVVLVKRSAATLSGLVPVVEVTYQEETFLYYRLILLIGVRNLGDRKLNVGSASQSSC